MRFGELTWWIEHGLFCVCFVVCFPSHVCGFLRVTSHSPTHPHLSVVILHPEDTTKSSHHPSTHQSNFFIKKNITIGSTLRVHSTLQSIKLVDPAMDGPTKELILSGTVFGFGVFNLVFRYFLPKSKEW